MKGSQRLAWGQEWQRTTEARQWVLELESL